MHRPPAFREDRIDLLFDVIDANPLGLLISCGDEGPLADSVPFHLDRVGEAGVLRTHLARGNAHLDSLATASTCLAAFSGPQAYVSPSWYPTKAETGRVVPTWNFVSVQARGRPRVIDDPEWIRAQIEAVTDRMERDRAAPWAVSDAPDGFIAGQMRGIVGVEIPIAGIEGKWKISQNRSVADQRGVVEGLRRDGGAGADVARLMEREGAS